MSVVFHDDPAVALDERRLKLDHDITGIGIVGILDELNDSGLGSADQLVANRANDTCPRPKLNLLRNPFTHPDTPSHVTATIREVITTTATSSHPVSQFARYALRGTSPESAEAPDRKLAHSAEIPRHPETGRPPCGKQWAETV